MEENKEMLELLEKIEKTNRQQARLGRLQCLLALMAALACVLMFVTLYRFLPQVEGILVQTQTVLAHLEQTTAALAKVDLEGMVADVDTLVGSGQQSLEQTMAKLNTLDFEALNKAIADLSAVVEPLANFFSSFRLGR